MARSWTTAGISEKDQFSYWREVICEAFAALDPNPQGQLARRGFSSKVTTGSVGEIGCSTVQSQAQWVVRDHREIRRDPVDRMFVNLQFAGTCLVSQDGRESAVGPGSFTIVDTTRPYRLGFKENFSLLCISVPGSLLLPRLRAPRSICARSYDTRTGSGSIAASTMEALLEARDTITEAAAAGIADALCALIATTADGDSTSVPGQSVQQQVFCSAQTMIQRALANPDLSATVVARKLGISLRTLYKAFEDSGTSPQAYIRSQRLLRCSEELKRFGSDRSISEIAYRWGFNDIPNFCRLFRAQFGVNARDFRRSAARARPAD